MDFTINLSEKRLKLRNSSLVNGWINARHHTWYPQIDIRSVVSSESREHKLTEIKMDSHPEISKWNWHNTKFYNLVQSFSAKRTFSLNTTVKCSMNLEMFPTESHICKIEVSLKIEKYTFLIM